ncbi:MAG: NTP transferase domain-containing protein [Myxococcota bacterium]
MTKTVCIIQARMRSERLPGKILAPLGGRPLLALLATRIARAKVDERWLATSSDPADDVTEAWGFELGLRVYRGHPTDVLSRFLAVAEETGADWLVRVTADNPFLDAPLIDALIAERDALAERAIKKEAVAVEVGIAAGGGEDQAVLTPDLIRPAAGRPIGYGVELVQADALRRAARAIPTTAFHHRVHVTSWLSVHGRIQSVALPAEWPSRPSWRWTVDTYEDLAMARSAFRLFASEAATIDYPTMVRLLDGVPEIAAMNAHIAQKKLEEG